jgi:hypothetical protein
VIPTGPRPFLRDDAPGASPVRAGAPAPTRAEEQKAKPKPALPPPPAAPKPVAPKPAPAAPKPAAPSAGEARGFRRRAGVRPATESHGARRGR